MSTFITKQLCIGPLFFYNLKLSLRSGANALSHIRLGRLIIRVTHFCMYFFETQSVGPGDGASWFQARHRQR